MQLGPFHRGDRKKERWRRSQAEILRETAFSARMVCQSPPLDEALGIDLMILLAWQYGYHVGPPR